MKKLLVTGVLMASAAASQAWAIPITVNFEGLVDEIGGSALLEEFSIGEKYAGSFTYESDSPITDTGFYGWFGGVIKNLNFSIGDYSGQGRQWPEDSMGEFGQTNGIHLGADGNANSFASKAHVVGPPVFNATLGEQATPYFLYIAEFAQEETIDIEHLPTDIKPDHLSQWHMTFGALSNGAYGYEAGLGGSLTSVTLTPAEVPAPGMLLMLASGLLGLCTFKRIKE